MLIGLILGAAARLFRAARGRGTVSNPFRIASSIGRPRLPLALATRPFNVGFLEH